MKIDDRVSNYMALMQGEATKEKPRSAESTGATEGTGSASAEVDLSTSSLQLADDEARRQRLDSIRQQLAEGTYNISGKDVASKILSVIKADS